MYWNNNIDIWNTTIETQQLNTTIETTIETQQDRRYADEQKRYYLGLRDTFTYFINCYSIRTQAQEKETPICPQVSVDR